MVRDIEMRRQSFVERYVLARSAVLPHVCIATLVEEARTAFNIIIGPEQATPRQHFKRARPTFRVHYPNDPRVQMLHQRVSRAAQMAGVVITKIVSNDVNCGMSPELALARALEAMNDA